MKQVAFTCPKCGNRSNLDAESLGSRVTCGSCGASGNLRPRPAGLPAAPQPAPITSKPAAPVATVLEWDSQPEPTTIAEPIAPPVVAGTEQSAGTETPAVDAHDLPEEEEPARPERKERRPRRRQPPIKFHCPHCGQPYEVEGDQAGLRYACEDCGKRYTVPDRSAPRTGDDRWAWALVAVPIAGAVVEVWSGANLFWPFVVFNTLFVCLDESQLKKEGRPRPNILWGLFLVPAYLWKRGVLLRGKQPHLGLWVGSFIVSMMLSLGLSEGRIEGTARPLVTQIIREQLGGSARCVGVKITDDLGGGHYRARATLSNGNDILILIESRNGMVYVTIP